ncbi:MAG: hypothetical protein JOZ75_02360 [Candidatus Dormibacteraeota bacterium]|nr:hypothetical protein [Candidatus Dormibacteraeota bacterium]
MSGREVWTLGLVAIIVSVVAGSCGSSPASPTVTSAPALKHSQITVAGQQRTYRVYRPPTVDPRTPTPLLLILHGNGSNSDDMANTTQFDMNAETHAFIVVYPDGIEKSWNGDFCCEPAPTLGVDDLAFLNALIPQVEHDYTIDTKRVFMTGFSSGAIMAYRYACQGAVPLTAIAPVAGTMLLNETCTPKQPTALLAINGTADGEVPYAGGHLLKGASANDQIVPSAPDVVALWAHLDTCASTASTSSTGPVSVSQWSGCSGGATVQLETITGAGHTWYATGFGPADGAIDATTVIGNYFAGIH